MPTPQQFRVPQGQTVEQVVTKFKLKVEDDVIIHVNEYGDTVLYAYGATPKVYEKPKPGKTLRQVIDEYLEFKWRERMGIP